MDDSQDPNYKEKVAKCLEFRVKKMKRQQVLENQRWQKVISTDKSYNMKKQGYKVMLEDLETTKKKMNKFKRGLSVFEDQKLRSQLLTNTAAPVLSFGPLRQNLQNVVLAYNEKGPQISLSQNVSKLSQIDAASFNNNANMTA